MHLFFLFFGWISISVKCWGFHLITLSASFLPFRIRTISLNSYDRVMPLIQRPISWSIKLKSRLRKNCSLVLFSIRFGSLLIQLRMWILCRNWCFVCISECRIKCKCERNFLFFFRKSMCKCRCVCVCSVFCSLRFTSFLVRPKIRIRRMLNVAWLYQDAKCTVLHQKQHTKTTCFRTNYTDQTNSLNVKSKWLEIYARIIPRESVCLFQTVDSPRYAQNTEHNITTSATVCYSPSVPSHWRSKSALVTALLVCQYTLKRNEKTEMEKWKIWIWDRMKFQVTRGFDFFLPSSLL